MTGAHRTLHLILDIKKRTRRNSDSQKTRFARFLGSIIFVVGKSPIDIMEPIFV